MAMPIELNYIQQRTRDVEEQCREASVRTDNTTEEEEVNYYKQILSDIITSFDTMPILKQDFNDLSNYARAICEFVDYLRMHHKRPYWLCKMNIDQAWVEAGVIVDALGLNQSIRPKEFFSSLLSLVDSLRVLRDSDWNSE